MEIDRNGRHIFPNPTEENMKFKFIENTRLISHIIDGPFNDPESEDGYDEELFGDEYNRIRDGLVLVVSDYCREFGFSDEDINVGHRTGPTRGIGLVVEGRAAGKIVILVERIHSYLKGLEIAYCVPIDLVVDEPGPSKDRAIGITADDEVVVTAEKKEWFKEIGIDC